MASPDAGAAGAGAGAPGEDNEKRLKEKEQAHQNFLRELASCNGLQLKCSQGEEESERHRREVERRLEVINFSSIILFSLFPFFSRLSRHQYTVDSVLQSVMKPLHVWVYVECKGCRQRRGMHSPTKPENGQYTNISL